MLQGAHDENLRAVFRTLLSKITEVIIIINKEVN